MSKVSRSVYQKLKEENKRLLADIKSLVMDEDDSLKIHLKWHEKFEADRVFHEEMKAVCKQYIKDHKDELPDFLTKNIE